MKMKNFLKTSLFASLFAVSAFSFAQNARVQIIHNSPDPAAASVDIYAVVNGAPLSQPLVNDLDYREATAFIDVPSGVNVRVSIAPGNSTSFADTIPGLTTNLGSLTANEKYIVIADGFATIPNLASAAPFSLQVFAGAREASVTPATNFDILIYHGSALTVPVDVVSPLTSPISATVADNLAYKFFNSAGYVSLPTNDYNVQLRLSNNPEIIAEYSAPIQSLNGNGASFTVIASGLIDPTPNPNAAFGVFAVGAAGGAFLPLSSIPISTFRVQVVHNSADPLAASVDVYVNGAKPAPLNDFAFRAATPFLELPANVDLRFQIAAPSSTDTTNGVVASINAPGGLPGGNSYILIARGVLTPANFAANPDAENTGFGLTVVSFDEGYFLNGTDVGLKAFHGSTDAPTVDVKVQNGPTLFDNLTYGDALPNDPIIEVPAASYTLDVTDASGVTTVKRYTADLTTLGGNSAFVFASGFLTPSANQDGAAFGLWVALNNGTTFQLPEIAITSINENELVNKVSLYPNPSNGNIRLDYFLNENSNIDVKVLDMSGRVAYSNNLGNQISGSQMLNLNLSELSNGLYYLVLATESGDVKTQKFYINK